MKVPIRVGGHAACVSGPPKEHLDVLSRQKPTKLAEHMLETARLNIRCLIGVEKKHPALRWPGLLVVMSLLSRWNSEL